ncbi:ubiquitin-specific protease doa4 [Mortierella sp. GBA43]|nr:ubiquitin-specific protease doa4 [Mortierella sp. GBA43]
MTTSTPTSTTIGLLDSPQQKIQSLVTAAMVQRDPTYTAKHYIRSAQSLLNVGDSNRSRGELEEAFVKYLRATSIVLEVIPQDKDFDKLRMDQEYLAIKKRVKELFSTTERIKELLQEKYEQIREIEASALETAAKADRPKPPPLPNKPSYLSASKYSVQGPIAVQPSMTTTRPETPPAGAHTTASNGLTSASLVPGPLPVHMSTPPISAPAVIPNGKDGDAKGSQESSSQSTTQSTARPGSTDQNNQNTPLSIKPQQLLNYVKQLSPPTLLLIDVRMQSQYSHARIKNPWIINIEPPALRDGMTAKALADQGLFNSPPSERKIFSDRATFELVIYYDQNSTELPTSGPLFNLFTALHDHEFEKPLRRRPVFLIGGFNAWLDSAGMNWVQGHGVDGVRGVSSSNSDASSVSSMPLQSDSQGSIPGSPIQQPQSHAFLLKLSNGGGINRRDGKLIVQTIGGLINNDDTPQSMVNPRIGPNLPNKAYPPTATPYSSYKPSSHNADVNGTYGDYSQQDKQSQSGAEEVPAQVVRRANRYVTTDTLQRRQTVYDNHWNAFGLPAQVQSTPPPLPPKPDAHMTVTTGDIDKLSGAISLPVGVITPTSTIRPPIQPKPMRPLPQAPGMNDLRDYTKFGSGFSKIGGSQLGKTGLTNLGNTCFMNSVIQCLVATPPLSRYFMDGSFKHDINTRNLLGTGGKLADAFTQLIRGMWSGQSLVVSPTSFRNAILDFAPQFKGSEQHDSQEFLSFLLDGLHEDLKSLPRPPPPNDDEGSEADEARMERLPEFEASEIAWQRYLRRDSSIIVRLFQGQFKNRLTCTKCGRTSTTYNAFMYLALPIKAKSSGRQPQTLTSCLNAFVESEVMEGDNAWNCPNCKKPRKAYKQLTISRVPNVLLIQLKRFSSDGPFKNKIKAMVQYPIHDLDLTKYLPRRPGAEPQQVLYDLYAVSNHSGEVSSGHYTACVRGESPDSWINFDDSRVSPCDKSVAVSEHGYTLFYVRKK